MAGKRKDIVALLDIGTARASVALARLGPAKTFNIMAWDESASLGVRKGTIIDTYSAARIIENLLANIEQKVKINVSSACVIFSGISVEIKDYCARISLGENRRVISKDVSLLLERARRTAVPEGFTGLHMLPLEYRLDGRKVSVPGRESGRELEADIRMVLAGQKYIQAVRDAVRPTGMRVRKVVFAPIAEAPLLINGAELQLGCVLVNLGAGTTTVSVFKYGNLLNAVVLPVGMDHVKADLAVGLRTTMSCAGDLLHSITLIDKGDNISTVTWENNCGQSCRYEENLVFSIIYARLEEICDLIKQSIHSMNLTGFLPGGVKLTGGGAMLSGIEKVFSRKLDLPVERTAPYVSVPGEENFRLSLAGLANYCCEKNNLSLLPQVGDGFDSVLYRLQGFIPAGNYFLRRGG